MKTNPESAVARFLEALPGGVSGKRLLVAVSGGADSVALLAAAQALSGPLGFSLYAATVQHSLRTDGTSEGDAEFVVRLCASWTPPVSCRRIDLAPGECLQLARKRGGGLEDAARSLRYWALERVREEVCADWILTGHTKNDLEETRLMRFLQGAAGSSLSGMESRRGFVVRPLMKVGRSEVEAYLRERGLPWREDPSNGEVHFLRNRIRHRLVPLLDEEFPGWSRAVESGVARASLDDLYIRQSFDLPWVREGPGVSASREAFDGLHPAQARRALHEALELLSPGRRVPHGYIDRIVADRDSRLVCGASLRFERRGNRVFWGPDIVHCYKSGYLVTVGSVGVYKLPFGSLEVTGSAEAAFLGDAFGPWTLPLTLRSRLPGDGDLRHVKKAFGAWAVPESVRDRIPLLEIDGDIRAVFGQPLGYPDLLL